MNAKKYRLAMSLLGELASEMGVPVRFYSPRTMDSHTYRMMGGFAGRERGTSLIGLRRGCPRVSTVYVLAHELGHAREWDSLSRAARRRHASIGGALGWFMDNGIRVPEDLLQFMLDRERVACDLAEESLQELEINVPLEVRRRYRRACVRGFERVMRASGR